MGIKKSLFKKIGLLVILPLFLVVNIIQLFPITAKAAPPNPPAATSVYERAFTYLVWSTLKIDDCDFKGTITPENIENGEIFDAGGDGDFDPTADVGILLDTVSDKNGYLSCGKDGDALVWLGTAIDMWGYTNIPAYLEEIGYVDPDNNGEWDKGPDHNDAKILGAIPAVFFGVAKGAPTSDVLYYIWATAFSELDNGCEFNPILDINSDEYKSNPTKYKNVDRYTTAPWVDVTNKVVYPEYIYEFTNDNKNLGYDFIIGNDESGNLGAKGGKELHAGPVDIYTMTDVGMNCGEVATMMKDTYALYAQNYLDMRSSDIKDGRDTNPTGPTTPDLTDAANTCEGNITSFGWIICKMLNAADNVVDWIPNELASLMEIKPAEYEGTGSTQNSLYTAWSAIRIISTIVLVGIALFMILAQIFSFDFVSAYSVKKIMPRLVVAVILMQLSWIIFTSLIQVFNVLGQGVGELILAPFGGPSDIGPLMQQFYDSDKASFLGTGLFAGIGLGVGIIAGFGALGLGFALLGMAVAVVLGLFSVFVTLAIRKIILVFLLALAPLAIVLWILPNTQKAWKMWWENYSKLLLMFPIAMGFLAIGQAFAKIVASGSSGSGFINYFVILIAYFGPMFMIPKTFKMGGSLMASVAKGVDSARSKAKKGIMESAPAKNLKQSHLENKKVAGLEKIGSKRALMRNWGRLQAGTLGTYGKYGRQMQQKEYLANQENGNSELNEILKGIRPENREGALKKLLQTDTGKTETINGKKVKASDRLHQAATLQALTYKHSQLVDDYMDKVRGTDKEAGFREFMQHPQFAKEFDSQMPDVTRGITQEHADHAGYMADLKSDSKGVTRKYANVYHDLSDNRKADFQQTMQSLMADGTATSTAQAIAHLTTLAGNQEIKPSDIIKAGDAIQAGLGTKLLQIRGAGGGLVLESSGGVLNVATPGTAPPAPPAPPAPTPPPESTPPPAGGSTPPPAPTSSSTPEYLEPDELDIRH